MQTSQLEDFNSTIGPYIGKTYKLMHSFLSDVILQHELNITVEQWVFLKVVSESPAPVIQNDLALITQRNKASLTRLLTTLEKKGFIFRKTLEQDSRKKYVFISEKGTELFNNTRPFFIAAMQKIQSGISDAELDQFFKIITQIQYNIQLHSNEK